MENKCRHIPARLENGKFHIRKRVIVLFEVRDGANIGRTLQC